MGAEYQADWNSNCTLLVCAFPNTPKFRQVEADCGTIVSKVFFFVQVAYFYLLIKAKIHFVLLELLISLIFYGVICLEIEKINSVIITFISIKPCFFQKVKKELFKFQP